MRCYELVDLALGDPEELCYISDDQRMPLPIEAIRETRGCAASGELFGYIGRGGFVKGCR
jgi:hypothetical protein